MYFKSCEVKYIAKRLWYVLEDIVFNCVSSCVHLFCVTQKNWISNHLYFPYFTPSDRRYLSVLSKQKISFHSTLVGSKELHTPYNNVIHRATSSIHLTQIQPLHFTRSPTYIEPGLQPWWPRPAHAHHRSPLPDHAPQIYLSGVIAFCRWFREVAADSRSSRRQRCQTLHYRPDTEPALFEGGVWQRRVAAVPRLRRKRPGHYRERSPGMHGSGSSRFGWAARIRRDSGRPALFCHLELREDRAPGGYSFPNSISARPVRRQRVGQDLVETAGSGGKLL